MHRLFFFFNPYFALSQLDSDLKYNFKMPDSNFASLYNITVNLLAN